MAAAGTRGRGRHFEPWPGYVDVLSTLLMVVIFVLMVFVISQVFLSRALSGRDEALARLNQQVAELGDLLALEQKTSEGLRLDLLGSGVRVCSVDPGLVETEFSLVRFHGDETQAKGVYKGMHPLAGEDVADAVVWAASRPDHVTIADMTVFRTAQGSATHVHRE